MQGSGCNDIALRKHYRYKKTQNSQKIFVHRILKLNLLTKKFYRLDCTFNNQSQSAVCSFKLKKVEKGLMTLYVILYLLDTSTKKAGQHNCHCFIHFQTENSKFGTGAFLNTGSVNPRIHHRLEI